MKITLFFIGLNTIKTVTAYPIGAGTSCNSGRAVGFPHATDGKGQLLDGGYSVSIDGMERKLGLMMRSHSHFHRTQITL